VVVNPGLQTLPARSSAISCRSIRGADDASRVCGSYEALDIHHGGAGHTAGPSGHPGAPCGVDASQHDDLRRAVLGDVAAVERLRVIDAEVIRVQATLWYLTVRYWR
jgi:hypothetical protein